MSSSMSLRMTFSKSPLRCFSHVESHSGEKPSLSSVLHTFCKTHTRISHSQMAIAMGQGWLLCLVSWGARVTYIVVVNEHADVEVAGMVEGA